MLLDKVYPTETIEFSYNYAFQPQSKDEGFYQLIDMNPFIYEMEVFPGKKKLVIIWELTIKTLDEQIEILSYKLECAYVIDYKNKMSDSLERIENLLQLSFKCFSDNYEHLKLTHTVRLKEINQYYDNSKHHAQQIYQMVWK